MKLKLLLAIVLAVPVFATEASAQRVICINGQCRRVFPAPVVRRPIISQEIVIQQPVVQQSIAANTIVLNPLQEEVFVEASQLEAFWKANGEDRFDLVIRATVRVTISGVCGSGTVVGRDSQGNALVLTNAHVAGTSRGRTVNLERWDTNGTSERGTGTIIAAGYGRGMSVDFALLRCSAGFAKDVTPIPLADRYPDTSAPVTTYGCPRCEWPSLQVLQVNRSEGQVLTWKPEAIGGRSGSSVIDHTISGPRVVGLLTWAGNGEGLGQSTPFLLDAMRGRLPSSIESLPQGVREVDVEDEQEDRLVYQVPATTSGLALELPVANRETGFSVQDDLIDSITEPKRKDPKPEKQPEPEIIKPEPSEDGGFNRREVAELLVGGAATGAIVLLLIQYGIPIVMRQLRKYRQDRGNGLLLSQEQFDELIERLQELAQGLAVMEARYERKDGTDK